MKITIFGVQLNKWWVENTLHSPFLGVKFVVFPTFIWYLIYKMLIFFFKSQKLTIQNSKNNKNPIYLVSNENLNIDDNFFNTLKKLMNMDYLVMY